MSDMLPQVPWSDEEDKSDYAGEKGGRNCEEAVGDHLYSVSLSRALYI